MRKIKFRAWHKEDKTMWFPTLMDVGKQADDTYEGALYVYEGGKKRDGVPYYPRDCEIMQYTGLKDKNGKEIYEGDIVAVYKKPHREVAFVHRKVVVEWINSRNLTGFNVCNGQCLEIIGNIYENKDLLK